MSNHQHDAPSYNRAFAIGIGLNVAYIILEIVFGFVAGSLALVADAGHNASDVLGLLLSWSAHYLAQSEPTRRHTYGLRRTSILAALGNALVLLVAIGIIVSESIRRLIHPTPAAGLIIVALAGFGVVINGITAWFFFAGRHTDLNIRSAFIHLAADTGVSLGVLVAGLAIHFTGLLWIDPVVSLVVAAVIAIATWGLLRDSAALAIDAVPRGINPDAVQAYLEELPGVRSVHHLHIWAISTTETALTAHLVKPDAVIDDDLLCELDRGLKERFGIGHATIQLERDAARCPEGSTSRAESD